MVRRLVSSGHVSLRRKEEPEGAGAKLRSPGARPAQARAARRLVPVQRRVLHPLSAWRPGQGGAEQRCFARRFPLRPLTALILGPGLSMRWLPRFLLLTCCLLPTPVLAANHVQHGLRLPSGFDVTEFAGSDLANDIYCL